MPSRGVAVHLSQPLDVQPGRRRPKPLLGVEQARIPRPADTVAHVAQRVADDHQRTARGEPAGRPAESLVGQVQIGDQHEVVRPAWSGMPRADVVDDPLHAIASWLLASPIDADR